LNRKIVTFFTEKTFAVGIVLNQFYEIKKKKSFWWSLNYQPLEH